MPLPEPDPVEQAELAVAIAEAICERFDTEGHPNCPICGNEICQPNEHETDCIMLKYYSARSERHEL